MSCMAVPENLVVNIARLESAIEELNQVRKDLQQNTHQVKCQIHCTVSRELEALRNREVWLLTQVDLLQNVKEEILRGQQAQINKALGSAQKILQYAQTNGPQLMDQVEGDMTRLELTDLEPEENAHISFQADSAGLRDTIMEFGRVEAGNRALQKVFADTYTPSASLPKSFEEYDDADHHVLYKTVEEVNRGNNSSSSILVNIPKLALKPEDWLIRPTPSPTAGAEVQTDKIAFPSLSNNISDWLLPGGEGQEETGHATQSKPPLTRDKSIQNWLLQIKRFPHTHDEEDDFEIVEHVTISDACSDSGMEMPSSGDTTVHLSPGVSPAHFTQVTPTTQDTWLQAGVAAPSSGHLGDENGLFQGFRHIPSETEGWLLTKGVCARSCGQSPEEPVEIENLGSLVCISDKNLFTHCPDDYKTWLMRDSWGEGCRVPPVGEVCKANEPCQGHADCLSTPRCGVEFLKSPQGEQVWLVHPTPNPVPDNHNQATFTHIKNMSKNRSDWLAANQSTDSIPILDTGAFSAWFAAASQKCTDWLQTKDIMGTESVDTKGKPSIPYDLDLWLMKLQICGENTTADPSAFSVLESFHKQLTSAAWLLRDSENVADSKMDCEDFEPEKRDLSEKAEMSKWLLNGGPVAPITGISEWLIDQNVC